MTLFGLDRLSPRFRSLWLASTVANLADGIFKVTLPLLALGLTNSPVEVALATTCFTAAWPVLAIHAGALADRFDRRWVLIATHTGRVAVLGLLAALVLFGLMQLEVLYIAAFLMGTAEVFSDTTSPSMVAALTAPAERTRANAQLSAAHTVTNEFIGPPLGALLLSAATVAGPGTMVLCYAVAAVILIRLAGRFRADQRSAQSVTADVREGMRYLLGHRLLRTLALMVAVLAGCWGLWLALFAVYVVAPGPGGLSSVEYGFLMSAFAVGGFAGCLLAPPLQTVIPRRWLITSDIVGTFTLLAVPAATTDLWAIGLATFAGGLGGGIWVVVVSALRQNIVPDHLLGRVTGVFRFVGYGPLPLAAAGAGILAEAIGIQAVFLIGAALTLLLLVPLLRVVTEEAIVTAEAVPTPV